MDPAYHVSGVGAMLYSWMWVLPDSHFCGPVCLLIAMGWLLQRCVEVSPLGSLSKAVTHWCMLSVLA